MGEKGGVPVIFLHHLTAVLEDWDPRVVDGLAANHHVIIFDNRGVGASGGSTPNSVEEMAADAVAFIAALGFAKVDLFGFSLGGFVARDGSGDFTYVSSRGSAHRAVGRQPRAMAASAAAQPPDPVGLEYLGPPPPRNCGAVDAEGICTSRGATAAPPNRSTAGIWPSGGSGRGPHQP
jgi:alpha/beta hydrolase fold